MMTEFTPSSDRHSSWVVGASIAAGLVIAVAIGTRVINEDLDQGMWRAVAKATESINPLAAIAGALTAVAIGWLVNTRLAGPGRRLVALAFQSAAVLAVVGIPVLLTARPNIDESHVFVVPALVVAVCGLLAWVRRMRRFAFIIAALTGAGSVANAAAYQDNSSSPINFWLALALLLTPLGLRVVEAIKPLPLLFAASHAVGLIFVLGAAAACEDDDCLPTPPWFLALVMAAIWFAAASLLLREHVHDGADRHEADRGDAAGAVVRAMVLPSLVLVAAVVPMASVEFDREAPAVSRAAPQVIDELSAPLAWGDQHGRCASVVGAQPRGNTAKVCDARFQRWVPGPLMLVERSTGQAVFDPYRIETTSRRWETFEETVASQHVSIEVLNQSGGAVAVTAVHADGSRVSLFSGSGDYYYSVTDAGVSPDGSWAYILDNESRLLMVPTDGSAQPTLLAHDAGAPVQWLPEFADTNQLAYQLMERDQLRVPANADRAAFVAAHRELEAALGLDVGAELVVGDGQIYVLFEGLPSPEQAPDGFCLSVTSFLESGSASWAYHSVDVGGRVNFCDASLGELDASCTSAVVPTIASVEDLEQFEVLVVDGQLLLAHAFGEVTSSEAYFQLSTEQVSPGPVNPDDLRNIRVEDFCRLAG